MFSIIGLIAILLLVNIFLSVKTNQEIAQNKAIHDEANEIKLQMVELIRTLHLLDLGLRGYALHPKEQLLVPFDSANRRQRRYFAKLETSLAKQGFEMNQFYGFRDTVSQYYSIANAMCDLLKRGDRRTFDSLFKADAGFQLQVSYRSFLRRVNTFEESIATHAEERYNAGLKFNSWVQIFLFILGAPTLFYIGYYASQTFKLAEDLHASEQQKVEMLAMQNTTLEYRVHERTNELVALNEEITAQNEEIQTSNEQLLLQRDTLAKQHELLNRQHKELQDAKSLIEQQHGTISNHNKALVTEVESHTKYLVNANTELLSHNKRLEQFAFVVSHNLRGPMTRILGLTSIFEYASSNEEVRDIIKKLKLSAEELDQVIKDLTIMTVIRNVNRNNFRSVDLRLVFNHVISRLEKQIQQSGAVINVNLEVFEIYSLEEYLENIFLLLLQNAIQFRTSSRFPVIDVKSKMEPDNGIRIDVIDNGIGIDLSQYGSQIFVPYRRFHFETPGKGLGLYTVKTQVETLGGTIEVFSKVNEGTCFRIVFKPQSA